ncbi:MAG: gliding motility protein GldL [Marinilabiliales bacterium]|nr:MAG: gliding motility protein GldL [Marinilabiliales bacterium]
MAKMYGIGASVVILGALFKIQHWPGAGVMLTVGLGAEAMIFFLSAFEPLHEEVDWTLVYPELAGMSEDPDELDAIPQRRGRAAEGYSGGGGGSTAALAKFDQMLESAQITPDLFERLGQGLKNLNTTTAKLSDISDATMATNEYVSNVKNAAISVNTLTESLDDSSRNLKGKVDILSDAYQKNSDLIENSTTQLVSSYDLLKESINTEHTTIMEGNKTIGEKLGAINKNLSALNAVYELQLQNNNDHLKDSQKLYTDFGKITDNLQSSVEETEKYKEEIGKLSQNLADLNSVYGNMLSAMSVVSRKK